MSDYIPSELYREILLRLPADSLLRLRSVCKAWRHLIDDPTFVKSHQLSSSSNNTLLIRNRKGDPLYLINLDSIAFTKSARQVIDTIPLKQFTRHSQWSDPRAFPFSKFKSKTCNGLILIFTDDFRNSLSIWNPLTRGCHKLPPPPDVADILSTQPATGLGYDYDADDYKVVSIDRFIISAGVLVNRTLVYSLNSGCWRRIKDCPYSRSSLFWCDGNGVFLNGAIHWLNRDVINVLDLGTEDYRQLALPPPIATLERLCASDVKFDAIGGCLSLTLSDHEARQFSGWVMKDYGADWVKLFKLDLGCCGAYVRMPKRLVAFLENKKQVLFEQGRGFLWYDVANGDVKCVTIHGLSISSSQICPGSIFRLDDSGNFGSKKRKRNMTKEGVRTRLKVCLRDCDTECSDSRVEPANA